MRVEYETMSRSRDGSVDFKTEPRRWVILTVFGGILFNNAMLVNGFFPYLAQIKDVMDEDKKWLFYLTMALPMILFAPMSFATNVALSKYRIHKVMRFAAVI